MSLPDPYPDPDALRVSVGEAGARLSGIEASEGAAGNIPRCIACCGGSRRQSCSRRKASARGASSWPGRPR
jgi:hypothetical protein